MFYLNSETELTTDLLHKVIRKFTTEKQPTLEKWKNYYDGKHVILNKSYADKSKPCNRIVTNYCKIVTDTYSGYICGKPVSYTSNEEIDDVQDVINYNDSDSEDMQFCTNALTYGIAYELFWLDAAAQVRYSQVNPMNAFTIEDNTMDSKLMYFVRWYDADCFDDSDLVFVEVYDSTYKTVYRAHGINGQLEFVSQEEHHFGDVPVSVFTLNDSAESIFKPIITLNDAYNELQSSEVDDYSAWCDAYLKLIGVDAEAKDIAEMKENRCLVLPEGSDASWLTKNASDTQIVNMLDNIKKNIFKVTACPDMADETFLAQSGTALAYKLVGFENVASSIVARFTKALQRRIRLICNILNIKASDAVWRDIQINFVRNLPVNLTETINLVNSLKGTVSDATLLSQIPFITDVQAELEAIKAQKEENMAIYGLGAFSSSDDEEEEPDEEVA